MEDDIERRRSLRLAAYQKLREERSRSHLFENPPGFPFEILFEREDQDAVADRFAKMYEARGIPAEYADIGVVYQNPYLIVCNDAVRFPTGDRGVYSRILGAREGQGAAGLPILPDGRIVLVRHARHASREWHWEIPRGFAEAGGDGAETARREVEEELGCEVRELEFLGLMHSDTGRGAQGDALYLVRVGPVDTTLSEDAVHEGIVEIRPVSMETFRTMLADGDITDSFTLAAYGLALAKGLLPG